MISSAHGARPSAWPVVRASFDFCAVNGAGAGHPQDGGRFLGCGAVEDVAEVVNDGDEGKPETPSDL